MTMPEFLHHLFGWVCGQYEAHTWSPGGEGLPCCQRCTGLYVGAFVAALLHLVWRPVPTLRWLGLNVAFLLFMIPSGFYWIPQNPELRCASGILFGFSLVAFLRLRLTRSESAGFPRGNSPLPIGGFAATLLGCLSLTPLLGENGNAPAAAVLGLASAGGVLSLAALLLANLISAWDWLCRRQSGRGTRDQLHSICGRAFPRPAVYGGDSRM
jgi:uncharacterized membrane protein